MKLSEMKDRNEKKIAEDYEQLKDCSQDELMSRLENEVKQQKERGVFNYDGLIGAIEKLKTFLPSETYENMKSILGRLK